MPSVFNHALLLKARLELDLTQEQVAASVGVDVRTYRRYESGAVNDPRLGFSVRSPNRRRVLDRLSAELGIAEDELLTRDPAPKNPEAGPWTPLTLHTLQRAQHFVGRRETLDFLSAWARRAANSSPRVVALVGVGGEGKTAIAERFLEGLGDASGPGGRLVFSFYDEPRTEVFLEQAARYFAPAAAPFSPGDILSRLEEALREGPPHLLVLDGLETVQSEGLDSRAHGELNDALLRRLLVSIARGLGNARALVTSRFELVDLAPWADAGVRTIRPGSLSPEDAEGLLSRWGIRADAAALGELCARVGGHALSVAMLGSYVGAFLGGDLRRFDAFRLASAERDDALARRLSAVLSAYARALESGERDLLARLSVFPGGVAEDVLLSMIRAGGEIAGSMAGKSAADLRRSLARLARLGLVFSSQKGAPSYSAHPFVRQHFQALLGVPPALIEAVQRGGPLPRLDASPRSPPRDAATLDAYEAMIRHLLGEGSASEAYGIYALAMGGFGNLGLKLGEMARGARILGAFMRREEPLPLAIKAAILYEQGLYAGALGDLAFACRAYEAYVAMAEASFDPRSLATGLRTLAYTRRLRGELSSAEEHLLRSIDVAGRAGLADHASRGVALLGAVLNDQGRVEEASARFASLDAMGETRVARRGIWRAEHDLARGRREEAQKDTLANLSICARLGWEGHVAHCHAVLGFIEVERDASAAAQHLAEARAWARKTGEVEMVLRCHELAALVALARGLMDEGAREASAGFALAETSGFGPFQARLAALMARCARIQNPAPNPSPPGHGRGNGR